MNFKKLKEQLEKMASENYREFIKAVISLEKGIEDNDALDKVYEVYQQNDSMMLLNDLFDEAIKEL